LLGRSFVSVWFQLHVCMAWRHCILLIYWIVLYILYEKILWLIFSYYSCLERAATCRGCSVTCFLPAIAWIVSALVRFVCRRGWLQKSLKHEPYVCMYVYTMHSLLGTSRLLPPPQPLRYCTKLSSLIIIIIMIIITRKSTHRAQSSARPLFWLSVTWPFDSPYAVAYWWPIGTEPLTLPVFEIFSPNRC